MMLLILEQKHLIMKFYLSLIIIFFLNASNVSYSQKNHLIVRSTTENHSWGKENRRDSLILPCEKVVEVGGFNLFVDTLYFHNVMARVYLPVKTAKQINYFEGSKIYDIMILSDPFDINADDPTPQPIFSLWQLGDLNSIISFDDDVNTVNHSKDEESRDEYGEKLFEGETIYFRKKIFRRYNLQAVYMYCRKDMHEICDFIMNNISLGKIK